MKRLKVSYMPFGDWPVAVRNLHAGAVGVFFLLALIGQQRAADHFLRARSAPPRRHWPRPLLLLPPRAPATIAPAPSSMAMIIWVCACASCSRSFDRWPPAIWPVSCASTPMIWFGVLRLHQRAGIDEDAAAVGDEGVEGAVVDDDDLDVLLFQAGGAQDRRGVVAQQLLDLGVADQRRALVAPAPRQRRRQASATAVASAISASMLAQARCAHA